MVTLNFLPLDVTFSEYLQVSEPLHLGELVYNVLFLAYSADVLWLVALNSMFFAVTWIFYAWIQHPALHKHHDQAMTKFQWKFAACCSSKCKFGGMGSFG